MKKGLMNKKILSLIFISLGIILLATGTMMAQRKPKIVVKNQESLLSRDEAVSLMKEKLTELIKVYERPNEFFLIEEIEGTLVLKNYNEKITSLLTENGIKQLEEMTFEGKKYITKKNEEISLLKEIPDDNRFSNSNMTINNVVIEKNQITSAVSFSSYKMQDNNEISYYVITKNLTIVKSDDDWKIENFNYSIK